MTIAAGVAGQAGAQPVAAFLTRYFTAINNHDYRAYASLFDQQTEPSGTAQQFDAGYQSTTDSGATLTALSPAATAGWAATVTFTSHQNPASSATHTACTVWDITLYLESRGTGYLIGHPPPGYRAASKPCS